MQTKTVFRFFVIAFFAFAALPLFGQVVYEEIQMPVNSLVGSVGVDDSNNFWMSGVQSLNGSGSGRLIFELDPTKTMASFLGFADGYNSRKQAGATYVFYNSFPPKGPQNLFGQNVDSLSLVTTPTSWVYVGHYMVNVYQAVNGGVNLVCSDYTIDGTPNQKPTDLVAGPFSNMDGSYFLSGFVNATPKLFQLGAQGSGGQCDLKTVLTSDHQIIQAYRLGTDILVEELATPTPNSLNLLTEIAVSAKGGPLTVLLGPVGDNNPQILTGRSSVDLSVDQKTKTAVITYADNTGLHAMLWPSMREFYSSANDQSATKLATEIRGVYFNPPYMILGGNPVNIGFQSSKVILANTDTGATYPVIDSSTVIDGLNAKLFPYSVFAVTSTGFVDFVVYNSNYPTDPHIHTFRAQIPGVSQFPPTTVSSFTADNLSVTEGDAVTLAWNTTNANSVSIDNGVGSVSVSGTAQVVVSGTTTFTLTATGYGGSATATVTVTATPRKPAISKFSLSTGEATSTVAQGSVLSVLGTNMCGLVTDITYEVEIIATIRPLPYSIGGCRMRITDASGNTSYLPMKFGITFATSTPPHQSQSNGQIPWSQTPGVYQLVVENRNWATDAYVSETDPVSITVVPVNPSLNRANDGTSDPPLDMTDGSGASVTPKNPAQPGGMFLAKGTGFGQPTVPLPAGMAPADIHLSDWDNIQSPAEIWAYVSEGGNWNMHQLPIQLAVMDPSDIGTQIVVFAVPDDVNPDAGQQNAFMFFKMADGTTTPIKGFPLSPKVVK